MDLVAEGFEIVSVAAINLDRDRLPLAVGQKPDDDLFVALLVVPIIPPSRQGVGVALQIAGATASVASVRGGGNMAQYGRFENGSRQQNLWVSGGSGSRPRLW